MGNSVYRPGGINQKAVVVEREPWGKEKGDANQLFFAVDGDSFKEAMSKLSGNSFKLWCYLTRHQDGYEFALSSRDARDWGIKRDAYNGAVKELEEQGYLVCSDKATNSWVFHEMPPREVMVVGNPNKGVSDFPQAVDGVSRKELGGFPTTNRINRTLHDKSYDKEDFEF